jgi:Mor family transcriptional regulator
MSYIKAENVLPQELIETIQQYVDGKLIYIPCKEKQEWGSTTSAKVFFHERNAKIYENFKGGMKPRELAQIFSLSEKSIQRILRNQRLALSKGATSV